MTPSASGHAGTVRDRSRPVSAAIQPLFTTDSDRPGYPPLSANPTGRRQDFVKKKPEFSVLLETL